jgi:hypothetical protein
MIMRFTVVTESGKGRSFLLEENTTKTMGRSAENAVKVAGARPVEIDVWYPPREPGLIESEDLDLGDGNIIKL